MGGESPDKTRELRSLAALRHATKANLGPQAGQAARRAYPERGLPSSRRSDPARKRLRSSSAKGARGRASTLYTMANIVTFVRIGATFVWVALAVFLGPNDTVSFSGPHLLLAALFGLIAFTDSLDGYLARSRNEVTDIGKFMDPIADKLICIAALLVLLTWEYLSIWVPIIVIAREFLVSGLRMVVAAQGEVVAASQLGKWKTGFTMGAIAGYLVGAALPEAGIALVLLGASWIAMAIAVVLTIWSGIDYLVKCWRFIL